MTSTQTPSDTIAKMNDIAKRSSKYQVVAERSGKLYADDAKSVRRRRARPKASRR